MTVSATHRQRKRTNAAQHAADAGIANPCIRNCCLDENKVCVGCGRKLPEILEWHHADNDRLEEIIIAAEKRRLARSKLIK